MASTAFACIALLLLVAPAVVLVEGSRPQKEKDAQVHDKHQTSKDSSAVAGCPCWNLLSSLKPEDCCRRVDKGSISGDEAKCEAQPLIGGVVQLFKDYCTDYCSWNCYKVAHPDDKEGWLEYAGSKVGEVKHIGEDPLLARASWQAQYLLSSGTQQAFVYVNRIHALHPVGSWREDTWKKTLERKEATLAGEKLIVAARGKLTEAVLDSIGLRSVNGFVAVPFNLHGISHVLVEGNGRMKAIELASQERPETLGGLQVEVTEHYYSPSNHQTVKQGILELWNQYVQQAYAMSRTAASRTANAAQIKEYGTFMVAVVMCLGVDNGWSARGPCKVVNSQGRHRRLIPVGTLIAVDGVRTMPNGGSRYKLHPGPLQAHGGGIMLISADEHLLEGTSKADLKHKRAVAWEYCSLCIRTY